MRTLGLLLLATAVFAQEPPRLQAVFPPGGKAGTQVEVVLRGGIGGAQQLLVFGAGVKGALKPAQGGVDESAKQVFEAKCATCHELRSPDNRQMAPTQWEATVDRMIRDRGADIAAADRDKIVAYLKAKAAAGAVSATVTIDPDATPGRRELRVVTPTGVSTAYPFVVSRTDEQTEVEPNNSAEQAASVTLPVTLNGACQANGDVDFIKFEAKQGQRIVARAQAYRLNEETQSSFSACLFLYDANQRLVAQNLGYDALDPLLDIAAPAAGTYWLAVRDLMYRGGPGSVYRLELGELPYEQAIYPLGARRGETFEAVVFGQNQAGQTLKQPLPKAAPLGVQDLVTPFGLFRFLVTDWPEAFQRDDGEPQRVSPPCVINGWIGEAGEKDSFILDITPEQVRLLSPWAVCGPFDGRDASGLDTVFPPEADVLDGGVEGTASYEGKGGPKGWEMRALDEGGAISFPSANNEVWYAVHAFELPQDSSGMLALGSDDGCKVWLNGQLVHTFRGARPVVPGNDLVPVRLRRGRNVLLLKVFNLSGIGGFSASAGAWSIDVFARRLNSPLRPRIRLGFGTSWITPETAGNAPDGDARLDRSFARPGEYGLQIDDAEGRGGERFAYRIEVAPTRPRFALRAYPANPSVPQGGRVPVVVERTSLTGYKGDLVVRAEGLPAGVTAEPVVLPGDQTVAVLLLEAAAGATPAAAPLRVVAEAPGPDGPVVEAAQPLDHFRIQNDRIPIRRQSLVAALTSQPAPYTLAVTPANLPVAPGETRELTVKLTRRQGFGADISVGALGLPPGVTVNPVVLNGGRTEAKLQVNFRDSLRREPFGTSTADGAYRFAIIGTSGGDGITGGLMYASNPVTVQPYRGGPPPAQPGAAPAASPADPPGRAVWERKCSTCHALYDPTKVRKTPAAWEATVDRMIQQNNAPISPPEREQILRFLQGAARQ